MVADETTMRLIDLHKYEAARNMAIADEVYRANANLLMHDEPVYRWVCWYVCRGRAAQHQLRAAGAEASVQHNAQVVGVGPLGHAAAWGPCAGSQHCLPGLCQHVSISSVRVA